MNKEKFKELWYDDELELVEEKADTSWRHGCYMSEVYKEPVSETYWRVHYQLSGDGEYHGIREDEFDLEQVQPFTTTKVITEYKMIQKETD